MVNRVVGWHLALYEDEGPDGDGLEATEGEEFRLDYHKSEELSLRNQGTKDSFLSRIRELEKILYS